MTINYDKLLALKIPDAEQTYTDKDTILYALGVGLGHDPLDLKQLDFVYEKNLKALPTFAAMVGYPGFWVRELDTGIDWVRIVNGEQSVTLHQPLKPTGTVIGKTRVLEVIDKGQGKGAVVYAERKVIDKATGAVIATVGQTTFCRADGGFGGPPRESPPVHPIPERKPDLVCDLGTRPEQAIIYRLTGDRNPLHIDPDMAKTAGFPKPIMHGLGTFGVVGHAFLKSVCDYDPTRVVSFGGRFSAPVFPGETIRTEMWCDGNVVSFRASVPERNVVVMNNGRAEVRG
ncbi:MaoC/PaaZ C-terminal domain-containing protein [Rhodoplanes sp. Z2-YC6860]|uniref:MaoC/PaaZ C-terminal domain-containing protein n=1 Tax=Rhodoplanes sp. Z2-YC6860 TaxID=674703 RepID=UPI00078B57D9|nr:MaoC/PaaZ C-terminal domain-containing protein [Rhodoplanes sp. Z2-YC6860]AMN45377.1 3-alpha,7-alpha,12-alpha-trihydroxy-5-beta-cholest-24-enoyl-CoA hydratase [Rhodoplanes sp. Z2-YC6860]